MGRNSALTLRTGNRQPITGNLVKAGGTRYTQAMYLTGCTFAEIRALLARMEPAPPGYRAVQVYEAIGAGARSFDEISCLGKGFRRALDGAYSLCALELLDTREDPSGTAKLRLQTTDGHVVEAVIIRAGSGRHTACLSTQAGCAMACVFCQTGALGLGRNLSTAEIVEQFHHINRFLKLKGAGPAANIVFMGMGEPLLNLEALRKACAIITLNASGESRFSRTRITVSTCGIAEKIEDFSANGPDTRLAVSLCTARQELRRRLMPGASALAELKEALLRYKERRRRRLTLELVLLAGLNTSSADAAALAAFAHGLDVIINLIPWNVTAGRAQFEGKALHPPPPPETERFRLELEQRGLKTALRTRKGSAIAGACGQLGALAVPAECPVPSSRGGIAPPVEVSG